MGQLPLDHKPRTHHLNADGTPKFTNRLIETSSPYLLQHAHNPVNWYAWGEEAFEAARRENRPILLSVGYSTCHWCHVMEEESFEDLEIARFLNENYVAIKVDREQRPDVDAVYMSVVQAMSGSGGWPMTVWLTPDRKPYYGGTYFPARDGDRGAPVGFMTLLHRLHEIYRSRPKEVAQQTDQIVETIQRQAKLPKGETPPGLEAFQSSYAWYEQAFDERYGGFGHAPKFPRPASFHFLFQYGRRAGIKSATDMALHTLRMMAKGGMYDQIGGGFHRYSVDRFWLVPHFEKMLYDNAQLVVAYLEAYQLTGDPEFSRIARETLDYVAREMTAPDGAFYSATDADSEGKEGRFFAWSRDEIISVLGPKDGALVAEYYGVTPEGNFEGQNVMHVPVSLIEFAKKIGKPAGEIRTVIEQSRQKLYKVRSARIPPLRDDKVLAAWNGLMIRAFARAGTILDSSTYLERAVAAGEFVMKEMWKEGKLLRSYRHGRVEIDAYLDDYAFLGMAFLELFEGTQNVGWLERALMLQDRLLEDFWDGERGGFFMTGRGAEALLVREKPYYDGAEPSGNAVAARNLLLLESLTGQTKYGDRARETFRAFDVVLRNSPTVAPFLLTALDYELDRAKEIVIVADAKKGEATMFLETLRRTYLPNRVLAVTNGGGKLAKTVPLVAKKKKINNKATAYVCENQTCELPTTDPKVFAQQISKITSYRQR